MAFGGNFYALTPAADAGLVVDPARNAELIEAGLKVMAAINAAERPVHPGDERINGCRHIVCSTSRGATAPTPSPRPRSTRAGWTDSRVRHGHERADGAAARARRAAADPDFVNQSVIGTRFTGRLIEETEVAGVPAACRRSRAAPGSRG